MKTFANIIQMNLKNVKNSINIINKKYKKEHFLLYIILILFFISNLFLIFNQDIVWWDAAVYIGMGKYIFSDGGAGLWEDSRPLVWPLILGSLWKLNLDAVMFGKIISLAFSIGILILTFLIGERIFDRKIAILATLMLALMPTFFFFSKIMLSGTISTFFILLALYLFLNQSYFFSGLFLGLGFMTRFLQLIFFIIAIIYIIIYFKNTNKNLINLILVVVGFLITTLPYLILNFILYQNFLHPFLLQILLSKVTGWMWWEPIWFYFIELFKENYLYLFAVPGIYYIFKKSDKEKKLIFYFLLIPFLFFTIIKHKEMRLLLILIPYFYLIASYGIISISNLFTRKNTSIFLNIILIIFIFQSIFLIFIFERNELNKENRFLEFYSYFDMNDIGSLWISNPTQIINYDGEINNLIYYPIFNKEKIDDLNEILVNADTIFLDTCDVLCNPMDTICPNEKEKFLINLKNTFDVKHNIKYGECEQFIFRKK